VFFLCRNLNRHLLTFILFFNEKSISSHIVSFFFFATLTHTHDDVDKKKKEEEEEFDCLINFL